jgi:hypothetical protein
MISKKLITMGVLALAISGGAASAQQAFEGRLYAFHSKAQGDCPALDWHVVAVANHALSGMIAWNDMKAIARVSGTMDITNSTFEMTAKEEGGEGRTATIDGQVKPNGWLVANISGSDIKCRAVNIPWYVPPASGGG